MRFAVLHQLRIKGLASTEAIAEAAATDVAVVEQLVDELHAHGLIRHRNGRLAGWSLTSTGRAEHARLLARQRADFHERAELECSFRRFLGLDKPFKVLCTAWQICDLDSMRPNGHDNAAYDADLIERLGSIHTQALAAIDALADLVPRFGAYGPRLSAAYQRLRDGDPDSFTTPLRSSYHDVWMELHEDLLLTLGLERGETSLVGDPRRRPCVAPPAQTPIG